MSRPRDELDRLALVGLLGSTAVAGLLFAPVFGVWSLLPPVFVVVLAGYGAAELGAYRPALASWRPLLVPLAALLGLVELVLFNTTAAGLPTAASLRALQRGFADGWLLTLQSTLPARPDPEQLLFVPLAVLLATVLGLELLLRMRRPVAALLPGLAVAGLAQAYQALTVGPALLAAAGYLAFAGLLLRSGIARPSLVDIGRAGAAVFAVAAVAVVAGGTDPAGRAPLRLQNAHSVPLQNSRVANPLQDIAQRLADPGREVFRYRSDRPADRWSLVVLDEFDGANWSTDARLYRLGARRPGPPGGTTRSADVHVRELAGPWLPSQPIPLAVDGLEPLLDPSAGTLLLDRPAPAATTRQYRLTWSEPTPNAAALGVGVLDGTAPGGLGGLGTVPADIERVAGDALRDARPTFQSALRLERYLAEHYQVATGAGLPTGDGWPQLRRFLTETRRGTSEQFAAAYVVLARLNGIPARLVVGFRGSAETDGDAHVVRNRDVLAWPEVPVAGVGWVPLDPTAAGTRATSAGAVSSGLAQAAAQARAELPPEAQSPREPEPGRRTPSRTPAETGLALLRAAGWTVLALAALLLAGLCAVAPAKALRAARRRRRTGASGVTGAWAEARDRLRAHGVAYRIGMTPRDLAAAAAPLAGEPTALAIARLGVRLDTAQWSGAPVTAEDVRRAWDEVGAVRRGLAGRPFTARLRAAVDPRPLRSPHSEHSDRPTRLTVPAR
ncbi:transglutaminaseTgpA domain-containing protein [Dactylosporangium sp. NPDC000244]|uniref:transglutaminase family protein n=1 Tax=Dactylosporangium sp. NPDC000244 TaxID=3154365 RepID=UPI0033231E26